MDEKLINERNKTNKDIPYPENDELPGRQTPEYVPPMPDQEGDVELADA